MIQGQLTRQDNGRYAIHHELTLGDCVEVYFDGKWEQTRIESSQGEYYFINGYPIDAAAIRMKHNFE